MTNVPGLDECVGTDELEGGEERGEKGVVADFLKRGPLDVVFIGTYSKFC